MLVLHPDWGIALAGADDTPTRVLWPYGYAGRWEGDRLALIDGSGRAVAYVGDQVELGGGYTDNSFAACGDLRVIGPAASESPSPTSEPSPSEPAASPGVARTLRTFAVDKSGACQDYQLHSPVAGTLLGDPEDIDMPIRLVGPQGRHSVVWPAGFTVAFEPTAVLYDEGGQPVAREGGRVELPQVWQGQASGSNFYPYHAAGMVFGKCYAREGAAAVAIRSAAWRLDPAFGQPSPNTATLRLRAIGDACSGQPPAGDRLLQPVVEYSSDAVVISLRIAGIASGECAGPETEFSATVDLQETLGARRLLDGTNEPAAERWPAAPFPVVEVADLGRSLEDRLEALVGVEGCAHVIDVDRGPWPIEEIQRDAAELPGGVGLVGPGGSTYVGEPQDAALAFGGFEAVHDGERWGLVGPYVDEPWLTGFGVEGEWAAAEMAEIELSGGRSAWAAGIYVTVIGQEQCHE